MMRAFLSLGSNLGDRRAYIREALRLLQDGGLKIIRASRVYETLPVEVDEDQENFFNMVVDVDYTFKGGAYDLLDLCRAVERSLGRTRPYHHAPRTMDIDVLLIEDTEIMDERLIVPHPRMEQRAFVIHPLADIAPDLILPSGRTVSEIKKSLGNDEIRMIPDG